MATSLQESQLKRGNILKKIKVEGEVDEGQNRHSRMDQNLRVDLMSKGRQSQQ